MPRLKHVAITTHDVEGTARFYIEVFGMKEVGKIDDPGTTGCFLSDGDINLAILNFKNDQAAGAERDLGFVFQEPTLMPWARVFDNVWLPLRLAGVAREDAAPAVRQALEMVGLSRFAEVYPRELSGGMQQRVAIARALVTRPRLLLMDEPFAALDEITRQKLNDDVLRLWRDTGFTVIFVTHSVEEATLLADRVVVMSAGPGRIDADIPVDLERPRDVSSPAFNEIRRSLTQRLTSHVKRPTLKAAA